MALILYRVYTEEAPTGYPLIRPQITAPTDCEGIPIVFEAKYDTFPLKSGSSFKITSDITKNGNIDGNNMFNAICADFFMLSVVTLLHKQRYMQNIKHRVVIIIFLYLVILSPSNVYSYRELYNHKFFIKGVIDINFINKIVKSMDVPEAVSSVSKVTVISDSSVVVENHFGVSAYSPEDIIIRLSDKKMRIYGCGLVIEYLSDSVVGITGKIASLSFV